MHQYIKEGRVIIPCEGNLLHSQALCLVNPVNCVGVMGKGLALQFKQRFPANFSAYAKACAEGRVIPGRMFVYRVEATVIINFPTKRHWRELSQLADIEAGLLNLVEGMQRYNFDSIAIPHIG